MRAHFAIGVTVSSWPGRPADTQRVPGCPCRCMPKNGHGQPLHAAHCSGQRPVMGNPNVIQQHTRASRATHVCTGRISGLWYQLSWHPATRPFCPGACSTQAAMAATDVCKSMGTIPRTATLGACEAPLLA